MVVPYDVSYSRRVREAFTALVNSTNDVEQRRRILAAAKTIDNRLQIYPQFGQPLRDLSVPNASLWIAVEAPLVVKYIIDEENRKVLVGFPFQIMRVAESPPDE